jgi:DNA-binding NtrC family response regulator
MTRNVPVVAIFNSSQEILDMLQLALSEEPLRTVTGHILDFKRGEEDFLAFIEEHDPSAIVYDVAPPYEENWAFLRLLRDLKANEGRSFVVTTTNKRLLEELAGASGDVIELVGKPFDLDEIKGAIVRALATAAR